MTTSNNTTSIYIFYSSTKNGFINNSKLKVHAKTITTISRTTASSKNNSIQNSNSNSHNNNKRHLLKLNREKHFVVFVSASKNRNRRKNSERVEFLSLLFESLQLPYNSFGLSSKFVVFFWSPFLNFSIFLLVSLWRECSSETWLSFSLTYSWHSISTVAFLPFLSTSGPSPASSLLIFIFSYNWWKT